MFADDRRKIRCALFGVIRAENGRQVRSPKTGANFEDIAATLIMMTLHLERVPWGATFAQLVAI